MTFAPWAMLRSARYALPAYIGKVLHGPDAKAAARKCERLHRSGVAATVGYFQATNGTPSDIAAANAVVSRRLAARSSDVYLSVKAPPMSFDDSLLRTVATKAAEARLVLMFDAHAPRDADRTLEIVSQFLHQFPGTGCVLPARWRRSMADAARFKETTARIRIVKGEWPDPEWADPEIDTNYLALISSLAGRGGMVAVATHQPTLAERALTILQAAGTPCELEQLSGLPRRRTTAIARRLGVPVRLYVPFGPGWWPYAVDKALSRPFLVSWMVKDLTWAMSDRTPTAKFSTGNAPR